MWVPVLHSQVAAEATALAEKEAKVVEELSTTNTVLYDDLSWYCAWVLVFFSIVLPSILRILSPALSPAF